MKRLGILLFSLGLFFIKGWAAEWQWSVPVSKVIAPETGWHPQAFLWIPENCMQVRAVMIGTHNMCEETLFENELFRRRMKEAGVALIWITPGWDQQWKADSGSPEAYWQMLDDLAETSGYGELKFTPIIPIGHSAMATYPWNFAAWHPECTLAVVSYHGDAPRTNLTGYGRENLEWGRTRNIDGIPGLMVEGEYEWWEARVNPALAFRMMYPESCISFLCDAGRGHFDVSDRTAEYIALFVKKALQARLPDTVAQDRPVALRKVRPQDGWLAERWHPVQPHRAKPAPYAKYKGDVHDAFWYFDREMAEARERNAVSGGGTGGAVGTLQSPVACQGQCALPSGSRWRDFPLESRLHGQPSCVGSVAPCGRPSRHHPHLRSGEEVGRHDIRGRFLPYGAG